MSFLVVGAGGVLGALLRYAISKWIGERYVVSFPLATLLINVTGSFLLGWLTSSAAKLWPHSAAAWMLFLGTGLCGAYTTFSTFSYEVMVLVREGRINAATLYVASTFLLGFAAAAVGLYGLPH